MPKSRRRMMCAAAQTTLLIPLDTFFFCLQRGFRSPFQMQAFTSRPHQLGPQIVQVIYRIGQVFNYPHESFDGSFGTAYFFPIEAAFALVSARRARNKPMRAATAAPALNSAVMMSITTSIIR